MKVSIVCVILLFIAIVSSKTEKLNKFENCIITQKAIGNWEQDGQIITQYSINIFNNSPKIIKSIIISTDYTFCLRDIDSIWNIKLSPNGELTLPSGTNSIDSYSSHIFYFIVFGIEKVNLTMKSITYS
ncbi:hypothetical protein DDB_G0268106 [Dictyostelium discoideum AX4]|uniref:Carbohydrate binding domain-containing protein n=1 Tax=Dictyostelium discoideum TaxID=44689 RepID=Q55FI0_DICDI|nr:hypothetical protein DDB_G0268106 [Dictyostelium discoideum AX4]EAL73506.1 hypothetical protein DDB_G0268106 [Dictyostelium discoideum AX4]|eukprot:XP_647553.1 hypothetical protein DDB_G0268106 [Dictyostelium discoideum AX4]